MLGLLGLGVTGGGAYALTRGESDRGASDQSTPQADETTDTPDAAPTPTTPEPTGYDRLVGDIAASIATEPPRRPHIQFDYSPIRVNVGESEPLLQRVEAVPLEDRPADTLRVFPAGDLETATEYLSALLGTTDGTRAFDVGGDRVRFRVGEGPVPFFLWSGSVADRPQMRVARGQTRTDAEVAVERFG